MRVLTFTKLYPNAQMPEHGIFVARRVQALAQQSGCEVKVVAPIPFYPRFLPARGEWEKLKDVPSSEEINSLVVYHPRYFNPPKIGMSKYGDWMAQGSEKQIAQILQKGFAFDVIDAHFVYPDGYAAVKLAQQFKRPVVVTARGSDLSRNKNFPSLVPLLRAVGRGATRLITVSEELRDNWLELGADARKIHVIPNGIDAEKFSPMPQAEARKLLNLSEPEKWLLSVARLDHNKGQWLILEALNKIGPIELKKRRIKLALVGRGESRRELEELSSKFGLREIVHFTGQLAPEKIRLWYNAADIKILASHREGSPNVVLEALACGVPVVASRAGRNPAVIKDATNGFIFPVQDADALHRIILKALDFSWDRGQISATAGDRSWSTVAQEVEEVFREMAASHHSQ